MTAAKARHAAGFSSFPPRRPRQISLLQNSGTISHTWRTEMEYVKSALTVAETWVAAHPRATVLAIAAVVVLKLAVSIL